MNEVAAIRSYTDPENIEYKLYKHSTGKYAVRIRDLDAGKNVGTKLFVTSDKANDYLDMCVDCAQN